MNVDETIELCECTLVVRQVFSDDLNAVVISTLDVAGFDRWWGVETEINWESVVVMISYVSNGG